MLFGLRCRESAGCGGGMQPFAGTLSRQAWVESTCGIHMREFLLLNISNIRK